LHSPAVSFEARRRAFPAKILDRIEDGHIEPQGRERAKQQGVGPGTEQRLRQCAGPADGRMPLSPVLWNVLEMRVLRQGESRGFWTPSRHAGEAIGTVADHGQVIGDGLGLNPKFSHHAGFVPNDILPAIELDYSRAYDTLTQVFVWRTNDDLRYTVILPGLSGS